MSISLIVAIGKNNEIGKNNSLLWHLPKDLKHFKEITEGHTVIMGRKTFESIGRPLPKRRNIIITKNKNLKIDNAEISNSLEKAISMCRKEKEVFIIGGGQIYKESFPLAQKLYVTEVAKEDKEADTFFPEIIPVEFLETKREHHKKDKENPYDFDFVEYERFF